MWTALWLSPLQFAFTVSFHTIFLSFTIGLAAWLTVLETFHLVTGKPVYRRVFEFWLKIFGVTFGMGVVPGIVLAFEFGMNWSRLSEVTGPIQGSLLTYESFTAFALEASFFGVLIFGRGFHGGLASQSIGVAVSFAQKRSECALGSSATPLRVGCGLIFWEARRYSGVVGRLPRICRQLKLEYRPVVRSPCHPNAAVMAFDNGMADGESDSHTALLGREHRVENLVAVGWIDTRASILDGHLNKIGPADAGSYA
jgi:hypothetical protein